VSVTDAIDLRAAQKFWEQQVEPFDWEHANRVSKMAEDIARSLGAPHRVCVMARACGIFHDIQRKGSFWEKDIHHAARGAEAAEVVLRANGWDEAAIRDVACTVAQHSLSGPAPNKQDVMACALWDADILDSARHPDETLVRKRFGKRLTNLARSTDYASGAVTKARGLNSIHHANIISHV